MHSLVILGFLLGSLVAFSWAGVTTQPPPLIRTLSAGGDIGPQFDVGKTKEPEGENQIPIPNAT